MRKPIHADTHLGGARDCPSASQRLTHFVLITPLRVGSPVTFSQGGGRTTGLHFIGNKKERWDVNRAAELHVCVLPLCSAVAVSEPCGMSFLQQPWLDGEAQTFSGLAAEWPGFVSVGGSVEEMRFFSTGLFWRAAVPLLCLPGQAHRSCFSRCSGSGAVGLGACHDILVGEPAPPPVWLLFLHGVCRAVRAPSPMAASSPPPARTSRGL